MAQNPKRSAASSRVRRALVGAVLPLLVILVHGLPILVALRMYRLASTISTPSASAVAAIAVYLLAFGPIAGALSLPFRWAVVPGRFPRDLGHPIYGPRRLYAICWTSLYYHPVVYHIVLSLPTLRWVVFRLFGYRGAMGFTLYPDTWVRDLPLLQLGDGSYLSNRSTVSPNICLQDGTILIAPVTIGARAMIGHATLVAPGVSIGDDAMVGVGCGISLGVTVGAKSVIGNISDIDRKVVIGTGCKLGNCSRIAAGSRIGDQVRTPTFFTALPATVVNDQAAADALAREQGLLVSRMLVERPLESSDTVAGTNGARARTVARRSEPG